MGFFKNLFEKKTCAVCGGEIGILGNRKLEDGDCCRECARKLSPWFTERRHSTVAEIKDQLRCREENLKAVAAFQVSKSYGKSRKILLDESAETFIVTDDKDFREGNPDVLRFSQVTGCPLEIKETKQEVYRRVRDGDGQMKNESYSPRRYRWKYDFLLTIRVNHPYIDEIPVDLSGGYLEISEYGTEGSIDPPSQAVRERNADYARYTVWAREIREILEHSGEQSSAETVPELMAKLHVLEEKYRETRENGDTDGFMKANQEKTATEDRLYEICMENLKKTIQLMKLNAGDTYGEYAELAARYEAASYDYIQAMAKEDERQAFLDENARNVILRKLAQKKACTQKECPNLTEMLQKWDSQINACRKDGQSENPQTVVCPWCGAETKKGKFCGNCGGKLEP